jgi:tetratricopeptide (TPR) repeat protein
LVPKQKCILIGWAGVDWPLLSPLIDAGRLPQLARLVERGAMGDLAPTGPLLPALQWTSMATGLTADRHGHLSEHEPDPISGGLRPIGTRSRLAPALWNMLERAGLRAHVVNWPATHPAEAISGVFVSDFHARASAPYGFPWPIEPGAVHPADAEASLIELRLHPGDLTGDDLLAFIPRLSEIDQNADKRVARLAGLLAEAVTSHAAATWILENRDWDFLAVHYGAIAAALSLCGSPANRAIAPSQSRRGSDASPSRDRKGVSAALRAAKDDEAATLSPGFSPGLHRDLNGALARACPDENDPREAGVYAHVVATVCAYLDAMLGRLVQLAGPDCRFLLVSPHGLDGPRAVSPGLFVACGPGFRRDELVHGAGVLDVVPTVLAVFDLPAAADLPGRPLLAAFEPREFPASGPAWAPEAESDDDELAEAGLRELALLGYAAAPASERVQRNHSEQRFHLAQIHLEAGRPAEAAALLETLVAESPTDTFLRACFAQACLFSRRYDDCRAAATLLDSIPASRPVANLLLGALAAFEHQPHDALDRLRAAVAGDLLPDLRSLAGQALLLLGERRAAGEAFRQALAANPGLVAAHHGLACVLLEDHQYQEAAESALNAIGLRFQSPSTHYLLGRALAGLGLTERAIQAFEICLGQRPGLAPAERWLAELRQRVPA